MDIFKDYNAFNNPQYYFRKAYNCANKEILKALGDERRGSASVGCVLICQGFLYYALVGNVKICVYPGRKSGAGILRSYSGSSGRTEIP